MVRVKVVLVETSHPGNIGATARAMLTMGFNRLALVNPKHFPHEQATAQASGADEVLNNITCHGTLIEAIADCHVVVGTSARTREFPWPVSTPRELAVKFLQQKYDDQVALVFGPEKTGLRNDELALCHQLVYIPTNPEFNSLNVAQAVQILCYELSAQTTSFQPHTVTPNRATAGEVEQWYEQLEHLLIEKKYLNPEAPRWLMRRLRRLFNRVQLEHEEVQILRGICKAMQQTVTL